MQQQGRETRLVKLPAFWKARPEGWFVNTESKLSSGSDMYRHEEGAE
jgi:hypothetical protein